MSKTNKFIYWTPRILSILFILFLALFSLDVITPEASLSEIIIGLFMHNIPVFILTAILIISWKKEMVGGVIFCLAGLLYLVNVVITIIRTPPFVWQYIIPILLISGPAFLIGILFFIGWFQKKKKK